jgi:hypothetical protein
MLSAGASVVAGAAAVVAAGSLESPHAAAMSPIKMRSARSERFVLPVIIPPRSIYSQTVVDI